MEEFRREKNGMSHRKIINDISESDGFYSVKKYRPTKNTFFMSLYFAISIRNA